MSSAEAPKQPAGPVEVGSLAPDFELPSQTGETVRLSDFVGKQPVVLYFYSKDDSGG